MKHSFTNHIVHIIGIGGIGMSAIAEILHRSDIKVQGTDIAESYITQGLIDLGVRVIIGHSPSHLGDATMIIRSTAIKDDHIEILEAKRRNLPILHRSEALALLLTNQTTIAVTGTHGKSTTTAMVGVMCIEGGLQPTVVNGAILNQFKSNVVLGNGQLAIIESDESDGSFLKLPADIGVITNMDADHLDYYGTEDAMDASYMEFIAKIPKDSYCLLCTDHPKLARIMSRTQDPRLISYSLAHEADIKADNVKLCAGGMEFDVILSAAFIKRYNIAHAVLNNVKLGIYGLHNVQNSLSAIAIGLIFGIKQEQIYTALANFTGIKRRFTITGEVDHIMVIDDYAHHPVEIDATLKVAHEIAKMRQGKVIAVMQPHRYTRLAALMSEFGGSFSHADHIILAEIYSANEAPIEGANSTTLALEIQKCGEKVEAICQNYSELLPIIEKIVTPNDIIIMLGAGDITKWSYSLPSDLKRLRSNILSDIKIS